MKMPLTSRLRLPLALLEKTKEIAKREGLTWQKAGRQAWMEWVEKREATQTAEMGEVEGVNNTISCNELPL